MIKIDIISGFLGAGKTTFIKKLLEQAIAGERVVLIENEFGEIGIDGGFLKDAGIEIREMNSGCICCSLVGDFGKSLEEVLTKYQPERVIIEPSGVGKLSDVMKAVRDVSKDLDVRLNSAVTIVDANKCKMYMKNFGEFFNNQIEHAGTIVLSRTDIANSAKIKQDLSMIREHNAVATIVTTPIEQLTGAQLLELIEKPDTMMQEMMDQVHREIEHRHHHHDENCGCGHEHHEHRHEDERQAHSHDEHCDHKHEDHTHVHDENCGCGHDHHHHEHHDEHHDEHHHDHHEHHHHHHDDHQHDHGADCTCGCHDHDHHHAEDVFTSWGMEHARPSSREELNEVLEELAYGNGYGDVLRAKGMIPSENPSEWLYFDLVPEQYEVRIGKPDYTGKVCVIGADLKEAELNRTFGRS